MKAMLSVLFFSVLGVTGSSYAQDKISIICKSEDVACPARMIACDGKKEQCQETVYSALSKALPPLPPLPPVVPTPPAPPVPPVPPQFHVPAEAHLACVGKKAGTEITWEYEKKVSLTGICRERNGKAYLKLSHLAITNSSTQ